MAKTISVVASGKKMTISRLLQLSQPNDVFAAKLNTQLHITKTSISDATLNARVTDVQGSQIYGSTTCRGVEITWPNLHLGTFDGVVETFPGLPVHAVSVRRVVTVVVQAVQIGGVASVVPPTAFVRHGTASCLILVVVSVFGAEGPHIMVLQ